MPSKEKEPYKAETRKNEGKKAFCIIISSKDNTQVFKKEENNHSKSQENGSEGDLSSLYVIMEAFPPLSYAQVNSSIARKTNGDNILVNVTLLI